MSMKLKIVLKEDINKWKKLGLKGLKEIRKISVKDMIIQKGSVKEGVGIRKSFENCVSGRKSRSSGPIRVSWVMEENKFLLTDGYHRVTDGLLRGQTVFEAEIDWRGYTTKWKIPAKEDRFKLNNE